MLVFSLSTHKLQSRSAHSSASFRSKCDSLEPLDFTAPQCWHFRGWQNNFKKGFRTQLTLGHLKKAGVAQTTTISGHAVLKLKLNMRMWPSKMKYSQPWIYVFAAGGVAWTGAGWCCGRVVFGGGGSGTLTMCRGVMLTARCYSSLGFVTVSGASGWR